VLIEWTKKKNSVLDRASHSGASAMKEWQNKV